MILRLKTFIVDVAGDLVTGRFWKAVLKQSLQAAVLSAAEAAFRALGRSFRDMGDRVRKQNASPGDAPGTDQTIYAQAYSPPAQEPRQDRPAYSSPTVTSLFRPSLESVLRGENTFAKDGSARFGQDVLGMSRDRFSGEQSTTGEEEDEDPVLIRDFDRHMDNLRG
jgi:hypothetical protein